MKFKVGDEIVVLNKETLPYKQIIGKIGKIVEFGNNFPYIAQFDDNGKHAFYENEIEFSNKYKNTKQIKKWLGL